MNGRWFCSFALAVSFAGLLAQPLWSEASFAQADKGSKRQRALAAFEKGTVQYNLGHWDRAIKHFKEAFEAKPDPAFLFNLAQAYRQKGDCKQGVFFYQRFLANAPDAPNRAEVEDYIDQLTAQCSASPHESEETSGTNSEGGNEKMLTKDAANSASPKGAASSEESANDAAGAKSDRAADASSATRANRVSTGASASQGEIDPGLAHLRLSIGGSFLSNGDLDTKPQPMFSVSAGYPILAGSLGFEVGVAASYTQVPWSSGERSDTASLTSVLANVAANYALSSAIELQAEVGVGVMIFSGLGVEGNVFVPDEMVANGALSSFSGRVAIGASYQLSNSLAVHLDPLVVNYAASPAGLREDIDSVLAVQALLGVGYRL